MCRLYTITMPVYKRLPNTVQQVILKLGVVKWPFVMLTNLVVEGFRCGTSGITCVSSLYVWVLQWETSRLEAKSTEWLDNCVPWLVVTVTWSSLLELVLLPSWENTFQIKMAGRSWVFPHHHKTSLFLRSITQKSQNRVKVFDPRLC